VPNNAGMPSTSRLILTALCLISMGALAAWPDDFPVPPDTQQITGQPLLPPAEALSKMTLPAGFHATMFAAEPEVRQPIAMAFDSRGRLWIAENYTYAEAKKNFDLSLHDRIVIFGDGSGDGHADSRSVFWDGAQRLTSVEVGFGGVYALCPPQLLFIPDPRNTGKPDGQPQVLLDGFDSGPVRHNIANGLKWGPDGWLYGRHGIQATSLVGPPGTPPAGRVKLNCSIWRYHPTRHVFEVVAAGTTNPWGMDWDAHGEAFFINTVIGHLWYLIPGAHYRRMYGDDLDPHVYLPIEQHADHVHWDTSEKWSDAKKVVSDGTSHAGGGHAHAGLMIYQGGNWPAPYANTLFTLNFHGRRVNNDILEPSGSGYVGKHGEDFLTSGDAWFRGVDIGSGPDGGVFMLDWSDTGECHNANGIHRNSGRIYKVIYGDATPPKPTDLTTLSDLELVKLQRSPNVYFARQSRQLLQGRAAAGADLSAIAPMLRDQVLQDHDGVLRLRALWAAYAIGACDEAWLTALLDDADEHVRIWAVRLLTDHLPMRGNSTAAPAAPLGAPARTRLLALAASEPSSAVRLALASALQRLPLEDAPAIAALLLAHAEDAADHNLPLMLWYGIKDLAGSNDAALVALAEHAAIPLVRQCIARRLAEDVERAPAGLSALLALTALRDAAFQADVIAGLGDAFKGWRKAAKPAGWDGLMAKLATHPDTAVRDHARALNALFGDAGALNENRRLAADTSASPDKRRAALQAVIENRPADLRDICVKLLKDQDVNAVAVHGLAVFDDPALAELLVQSYHDGFAPAVRPDVISVLASRAAFARVLLANITPAGVKIARADITPFHARQISGLHDEALTKQLTEVWGVSRESSNDLLKQIAHWKSVLTPAVLSQADRHQGRLIFATTCSVCHRLFGEGASIGPDLTGAGRDSSDYLIENIVDPSAIVAADYRLAVVNLVDGRIIAGLLSARTERTITVQTMTERLTLERTDIKSIDQSATSLMPEGLFQAISETQVRDLVGYLMSKEQISLPGK
jgi:putative membrane-bound dehydrogenase-like protein